MSKVRVYELARELNVETKVLLSKLKGPDAKKSPQSTLTDQQVAELRSAFGAAAAPAASGGAATTPKVVVRRRAATATAADGEGGEAPAPAAAEAPRADEPAPPPAPAAAAKAAVATPGGPAKTQSVAATVVRPAGGTATVVRPATPAAGATVARPAARVETPQEAKVEAPAPEAPAPVEAQAPAPTPPAPPAQPAAAAAAPASARPAEAPRQQGGSANDQAAPAPSQQDIIRRRREAGGATIVRRATPEEVEKLQSAQQTRQAGRKEDHRGTRVTGLGLLSNRISGGEGGPGGAPGAAGQAGLDDEAWGSRRPAAGPGGPVKDKKTLDEEEQARKRAAATKKKTGPGGHVNMRALLEQAEILTSDQDVSTDYQGRTVYTPTASRSKRDIKRRKDLKKTQITTPRAAYRVVEMEETITVGELAKQMAIKASEIIKKLMGQGVMATINQALDVDTATLIASEFGFEVKNEVTTVEDIIASTATDEGEAEHRPPIVTVMGHVDHGKTSILDAIRQADVASGEAGGITQHIGAYQVLYNEQRITFLDTPGHEAFSAMRARGAKVTDIVVLVVAADDGVMPQTVEAINHAKAAGVPIIVAVNKIDKHNINLDRVYTELTEHGIQAEEWGGETQFIKVSALKKTGITELLEAIVLQSEVLDLKATTEGQAEGAVIEAHLDKGRGPVATIVVQKGTLKVGEYIVAGTEYGRVRAMQNDKGIQQTEAGPSEPVEIIGLSGVPMAGDKVNVVADEKTAREAAEWRLDVARKAAAGKSSAQSLEDLLAKVKTEDVPEVPIILKGDTQGSIEAIRETIMKTNTPKVKNRIVHAAVGGVTESDVTLATASGALIIAFNVRAGRGLDEQAEKNGVVIKYFSIIYEIVDAVKAIMVGKLPPIVNEVVLGHAEVRKPISVPKIGTIAGSAVLDGKITRASHCRLIRDSVVIYTGKLGSLRRFKDDVKEVAQGYECGIGIDGYNDLKEGDVIEAFVLEETAATL